MGNKVRVASGGAGKVRRAEPKVRPVAMPAGMAPKNGRAIVVANEFGRDRRGDIVSEERVVLPTRPVSITAAMLDKIEADLRWAYRIVAMGPGAGLPGVASQLGALADVDPEELATRVQPTAADISRAGRIFEAVLVLDDPFERRLVYYRAARKAWRVILALDPQRRCARQLRRVHAQAIGIIWFSDKNAFT